jgi:hypothetical protein
MELFRVSEKSDANGPTTIHIAIMVDTQAIIANNNISSTNVIYMVDDNGSGASPSTGEGTDELNTHCRLGNQISWKIFAINGNDSIEFTGFHSSSGNLFGDNPPSGVKSEYLATVVATGNETYQVGIKIAGVVPYTWDPFITSEPA